MSFKNYDNVCNRSYIYAKRAGVYIIGLLIFHSVIQICFGARQNLLHNELQNDILQTIPDDQLRDLRDIYKYNWPYASQAFTFVDQWIRRKRQNSNTGVRFTSPNGNWQIDGTFVAIVTECTYNIYFFTLDIKCTRLCEALSKTKLIDWPKGPYICAIHEDQNDEMMKTLQTIADIDFEIESTCWWLPKEKAIEFRITTPLETRISALIPAHSSGINQVWPHSFPGSEGYLANLIETNGGFGVFIEPTRTLVSWIMTNDFGALAILGTLPEHTRKGFATLLVKYLARENAKLGRDSITYIVRNNLVSQTLFKSLGFKLINNVRWVQFAAKLSKSLS